MAINRVVRRMHIKFLELVLARLPGNTTYSLMGIVLTERILWVNMLVALRFNRNMCKPGPSPKLSKV